MHPVKKKVKKEVKKWDKIWVMYVGTLSGGKIFDTNIVEKAKEGGVYNNARPYEPLTFVVGAGKMIPWFDKGVVGMKLNETKKIHIPANEAYGPQREEMIKYFSGTVLDEQWAPWKEWKVGEKYVFQTPVWPQRWVLIKKDDNGITIDFNHELAGKDLDFEITVVSIQ